jgi:hypothetical protein
MVGMRQVGARSPRKCNHLHAQDAESVTKIGGHNIYTDYTSLRHVRAALSSAPALIS